MVTKRAFIETETFGDAVNILNYKLKQRGSRALRPFLYPMGEKSVEVLTKWAVRKPMGCRLQILSHFRQAILEPDLFIEALGAGNWQAVFTFEQLAETLVKYYTPVCSEHLIRGKPATQSAFEEGKAYFARNKVTLTRRYEGKYIAIWKNDVIDSDTSFSQLAKRVYEKIGYVSVFMPFVTSKRRILRFESPQHQRRKGNGF